MTLALVASTSLQDQYVRRVHHPFADGSISIQFFGKPLPEAEAAYDWRTSQRHWKENGDSRAEIAVQAILAGAKSLWATDPHEFNRRVVPLDDRDRLFPSSMQRRYGKLLARWGCRTDGLELALGDAYYSATADCLTIVAYHPDGTLVAAHAGRDCLITEDKTVVENILDCFPDDRKRLSVALCLGICAEHFEHEFEHPEYGEKNRAMLGIMIRRNWHGGAFFTNRVMKVSLDCLARTQLMQAGVQRENITVLGPCPYEANDLFYSRRRGESGRNGILVTYGASHATL